MRIAILWQRLSGYFDACASTLAETPGTEVMMAWREANGDAPFQLDPSAWNERGYHYPDRPDGDALLRQLEDFAPDVLLVNSWHVAAYRTALRRFAGRSLRVLCMDNQWHGTTKQWLGVVTAPWTIRPLYDKVFLPGQRQAAVARRLGFQDHQIATGLYSCDHDRYRAIHQARCSATQAADGFLFVGRLVREKGVDLLPLAMQRYRKRVPEGPSLTICGTGPLGGLMQGPDIDLRGFVQPDALPEIFRSHGCLVLPSRFEPWGVVIHEAVTAGLSVICSEACGAADDLVEPGTNGAITRIGDVDGLADAMARFTLLPNDMKAAASEASYQMSKQFTPALWASRLLDLVKSS